jgi:hypothetical protein
LVVSKEALAAFSDPHWQNAACDHKDLAAALRGPPLLFEVEGLEQIRWHEFTHAYGSASELPKDIRRLASSDSEVREQALWELSGSIYHQGTIYPATAVALPFLIGLALDRRTPEPVEIWELLAAIAQSCVVDPSRIRETWAWRCKKFGEIYARPSEEMAATEIATINSVRATLLEHIAAIRQAANDAEVSETVQSLLGYLERQGGPS